jgi:hypothetical protein
MENKGFYYSLYALAFIGSLIPKVDIIAVPVLIIMSGYIWKKFNNPIPCIIISILVGFAILGFELMMRII